MKHQVRGAQREGCVNRCSERLVDPTTHGNGADEARDAALSANIEGETAEQEVTDELVDEDEEAAELRKPIIPEMPCKSGQEDHRRTHWPYRSWCKWCNEGRGLGERRGGSGRPRQIPVVGIDYFFITVDGFKLREDLKHPVTEEGEKQLDEDRKTGRVVKCVLVRCTHTKCVFAHVVPCKGRDENSYVVDIICSDIAWLGHVKLLLKTDNEHALLTVVKRALVELKCQIPDLESISNETSAQYDSKSNGSTEVGVRIVRGQFRTIKMCLEDRLGQTIPA